MIFIGVLNNFKRGFKLMVKNYKKKTFCNFVILQICLNKYNMTYFFNKRGIISSSADLFSCFKRDKEKRELLSRLVLLEPIYARKIPFNQRHLYTCKPAQLFKFNY